uniref:Long-chain-fatty-acid--CoA ligase @ Long-chain fatty-acid-CoA ligase, Mycobacterial subgroup FadD15 n=1 Tax=uncultured Nocardioidaceae bacterium TaxID=253824 RepID=A0A6J4MKB9_9ACTN|nr:MAG: Long-chain-fatty-acid--CoA ligase @ Long-chain fatty-acid-CoA ligase, Mycobacterial subgroup FadD15 [uncultured Nocardioidaceae bacterium]
MRSFAAPPTFRVPASGSLTDDVLAQVAAQPGTVGFSRTDPDAPSAWEDVTYREFRDEVVELAKGLIAAGIGPGDRVGLMSATRYEWTLVDYAIWWAGAVSVPIYESSAVDQVCWILADSGAVACFVESAAHLDRVNEVRDQLPELTHLWSLDGGGLRSLRALAGDIDDEQVEARRAAVTPESIATLIYTSGTTGRPKGCVLTHGNFMFELGVVTQELDALFDLDDASTLLFLPLAHIFARIIEIGCVRAGVRLGHTADIKDLLASFEAFQPSFILAVPRVLEKVFNSASQRARADGRGTIFDAAARTSIEWSRARDNGGAGLRLRLKHSMFDRLVYARLRAALGGRTRYAVCGGAPLGERLTHFFRGIGVPVLEGYGLTETTAALPVNLPHATRVGTVGRPLPGNVGPARRRRRAAVSRRAGVPRLLERRGGDCRRAGRGRLVPCRRHRGDRRRRLRPDHRPPEGDPGDGRRQERRPRHARGPHPGLPAGQPGPRRR